MKPAPNCFNTFIYTLLSNPEYGITPSEDISGEEILRRPRVFNGVDGDQKAVSHNELVIFKLRRNSEFRFPLFFLPWLKKFPPTLTLMAVVRRPDTDDTSPIKVICFDYDFYDHLAIMCENGTALNLRMSAINSSTMKMGYIWNPARQRYEQVFEQIQ